MGARESLIIRADVRESRRPPAGAINFQSLLHDELTAEPHHIIQFLLN